MQETLLFVSPQLGAVRKAIRRGSPLGGEPWQQRIAKRLGLESTLRPLRRPSKSQEQTNELRPFCSLRRTPPRSLPQRGYTP